MPTPRTLSKAWSWLDKTDSIWRSVSDEFLPVALRWRDQGYSIALDLGCGLGRHSLFLAELDFHVTAVDLSEEGVSFLADQAREKGLESRIDIVLCDLVQLDLDADSFDCVVAFHAIYHTDYQGLRQITASVKRILKSGGSLYVTFNSKSNPSYQNTSNVVVDEHTIVKNEGSEKGVPHVFVDDEDILQLMAGFEIRKKQHIGDYYNGKVGWHYYIEAALPK